MTEGDSSVLSTSTTVCVCVCVRMEKKSDVIVDTATKTEIDPLTELDYPLNGYVTRERGERENEGEFRF